jgi:hypothetical protein
MKEKKDKVVVTKSGIKYTISSKVKLVNDPYFEKKADEGQKFLDKVGIPDEFKNKK